MAGGASLPRVKKTSIYLDPDVDRALGHRARVEGKTKAAVIRQALSEAAAAPIPRPAARGVFDGPDDLARDADRYLRQTGFGRR